MVSTKKNEHAIGFYTSLQKVKMVDNALHYMRVEIPPTSTA